MFIDGEKNIFMTNYPQNRKANIVVQDLENEILIYDLSINKAYCLNQTSALVFQFCDGNSSVAEISDAMSIKLKTLVSEDLVWLAIEGLKKDNLIENEAEVPNHFVGLSRREVVKRVGLASMVILPIISSIVAPSAANAQSGCVANGGTATYNQPGGAVEPCLASLQAQCCSGNYVGNGNPGVCQFFAEPEPRRQASVICIAAP
jgi:hypothetical protein